MTGQTFSADGGMDQGKGPDFMDAFFGKEAMDQIRAGKPLNADLVPSNTPLTDGEVFTTSGLQGALFPPDIPVARVVGSHTGASAAQETVTLQPLADLTHLRYGTVVLWGSSS